MSTKIQWTDVTWSPVTGCTKISAGCTNCYAERMARRLAGRYGYPESPNHFDVTLHPDRLEQPLRWKKPRRVFVCSMSDLFHEDINDHFRDHVFEAMDCAPQHIYQVLTKRPEQMRKWILGYEGDQHNRFDTLFPGVQLGVTAENQEQANKRISELLRTPAAVRFVSVEPMLGPVNLRPWLWCGWCDGMGQIDGVGYTDCPHCDGTGNNREPKPNWIICGCETGPGRRPMELEWAIDLVRQCKAAGIPVFVKQIEANGKISKKPDEWPEELRVREYPACLR